MRAAASCLCILFAGLISAATRGGEMPTTDSLMVAARAEMAASNRHDLAAFIGSFTANPVILADAYTYSYRGKDGITEFFKHNALGTSMQITIKPGAPQVEDRIGGRAYLVIPVNFHATDANGDAFNDPGYWIGVLVRENGIWKIDALNLTP